MLGIALKNYHPFFNILLVKQHHTIVNIPESCDQKAERSLTTRIRDWFNGGNPDGRAKIRQWARGYDDKRPEGYTYGMMGPAMGLSVFVGIFYSLTNSLDRKSVV